MRRKLTTRTSTAASPSSTLPLTDRLNEPRIIEQDGKRFRVETLGGKEFKLPSDPSGRVSWSSISPEDRVAYAIAYCKDKNCGTSKLPNRLWLILRSHPEEIQKVLDGIGIEKEKKETLDGIQFILPLNREGNISWGTLTPEDRVAYSIAYCKEHNCRYRKLPSGLLKVLSSSNSEVQQVLKGLGIEKERVEIIDEKTFIIQLSVDGTVSWQSLSPEDQVAYAIAYCKENNCAISKIPDGLRTNLTPDQRAQIRRELSKSTESDQLADLANAMEGF